MERRSTLRPRAWLFVLISLATWCVPHASAQENQGARAAAALVTSAESAPGDPFNRGTPRRAMKGFLEAGSEDRWDDAAQYLDLADLPEEQRVATGASLARQLKIVIDQKQRIDLKNISDEAAGVASERWIDGRELVATISHDGGSYEIVLDRVPREGDGVLVWKISSSTIAHIPEMYAAFGYGPLAEHLPKSLTETRFLELALWQWLGLIALVILAWFVAWAIASLVMRIVKPLTARSTTDLDDRLLALMIGPLRLLATIGLFNAGLHFLHLTLQAVEFARGASAILVIFGIGWLVFRVIDLFAASFRDRLQQKGRAGAVNLVPLGARALKIAVGAMTVLATLDTYGFDVTTLIAGLGVGGLAIALAAQKTVENVFGGISVLLDQPVRPGDFCKFGDKQGTVEDIGVRSTRLRTPGRTVISVPNSEFSTLQLENFARRDKILLQQTIGLRYETTPDQLRYVMAQMRRMLLSHPKIQRDPVRVRFVNFGASSLDLELFAYVDTIDAVEFLAVREDVFLRILDIVAASGCGFAFPSTTMYAATDDPLDPEKRSAAEAQVARWREEGSLMYPDFHEDDVRSMERIDWPPRGSSASRAGRKLEDDAADAARSASKPSE